jgi:acyl-CoA synthetase (AMP-forming)/AMP-acid ligase II
MRNLNVALLETSDSGDFQSGTPPVPQNERQFMLDQPALILFTSGTTGAPKGVVHTHRSLRARWEALKQNLGLASFRRTLCLLPTHFGHGLVCNCLFPWLSGMDLLILPAFDPRVLVDLGALIDRHGVTSLSSVPAVWRIVLRMTRPPAAHTLERVLCGSAPLSAEMWKGIQQWSGAREVLNAYGITETASWVAGTTMPYFTPEDGLIGEAWGTEIKILKNGGSDISPTFITACAPGESGSVWIRTPALMAGYMGQEELTREVIRDGWFLTGDIGIKDERGWIYLCGRTREEINKGGIKVYPSDVDAVIDRCKGVADVCCFGYDGDPLYGQNVAVALTFRDTADRDSLEMVYEWTKQHVAAFKLPVRWYVVESIPRTSRGKVNRAQVAADCAQRRPAKIVDATLGDQPVPVKVENDIT